MLAQEAIRACHQRGRTLCRICQGRLKSLATISESTFPTLVNGGEFLAQCTHCRDLVFCHFPFALVIFPLAALPSQSQVVLCAVLSGDDAILLGLAPSVFLLHRESLDLLEEIRNTILIQEHLDGGSLIVRHAGLALAAITAAHPTLPFLREGVLCAIPFVGLVSFPRQAALALNERFHRIDQDFEIVGRVSIKQRLDGGSLILCKTRVTVFATARPWLPPPR